MNTLFIAISDSHFAICEGLYHDAAGAEKANGPRAIARAVRIFSNLQAGQTICDLLGEACETVSCLIQR